MRKKILIFGVVLSLVGFILNFLAGATLPGGFTIPLIYGSNQTLWLFVSFGGLFIGLVGLILKKKNKEEKKSKEEQHA
jgi:LPXTG-motif cell wall-anchored protein